MSVYTIRDLEQLSGVPRTTIHYYLRQGLLPRPQKTAASRSLYTDSHLDILKKIGELKQEGFSITEIERRIEAEIDHLNDSAVDLAAQEYDRLHNHILAVAAEEFVDKGYKNTHVTTLMRRLGITATVFYTHFPSKRKLLAECVSVIMSYSLTYGDEKTAAIDDPAERQLWHVFSHSNVFELGTAAFAVIRVEGTQNDAELRKSMEDGLAQTVARIERDLTAGLSHPVRSTVPDELIALSLFGAYEQTVFRASPSVRRFTRKDLLRTQLWLFLAARAARNGEVDIDGRVKRYERLLTKLSSEMPPLPPSLLAASETPPAGYEERVLGSPSPLLKRPALYPPPPSPQTPSLSPRCLWR